MRVALGTAVLLVKLSIFGLVGFAKVTSVGNVGVDVVSNPASKSKVMLSLSGSVPVAAKLTELFTVILQS